MHRHWNRRQVLRSVGGLGILAAAQGNGLVHGDDAPKPRGNIKHSICRWCYQKMPLTELAAVAKRLGYQSIELLTREEFVELKPLGLTCAILKCKSIPDGLNRKENHGWIEEELRQNIDFAAAHGIPNVICMSGNRKGMPDDEGLENCAIGLKKVVGFAEEKKVTICMELLNSKVNHKDYMGDRTPWGVALVKKVGSERFKLLYDIYHMQIMEGDVIATIAKNKDYIAHYHTGGVPGRHEIDDTQELNYPAIVKAIVKTGYQGFLGQEFIPARDPVKSLEQALRICDV